jgi:hypothetical protein
MAFRRTAKCSHSTVEVEERQASGIHRPKLVLPSRTRLSRIFRRRRQCLTSLLAPRCFAQVLAPLTKGMLIGPALMDPNALRLPKTILQHGGNEIQAAVYETSNISGHLSTTIITLSQRRLTAADLFIEEKSWLHLVGSSRGKRLVVSKQRDWLRNAQDIFHPCISRESNARGRHSRST